uniref:prostate and testis expressed protein 4 n=1 Tax=Myodes glareolus TaxID=447135 RepID=UPI002020B9EF|nr:prostate and testis expressed protein 4 [Myodes glareolus]
MNPATKVSTVLIVTLSFLCLVEGLTCNVCDLADKARCKKGKSRCTAQRGQSCASISTYIGSKHVSSKQLCMPNCVENNYKEKGKSIFVMCCERNLCNSF